ncbi:MAG TPA: response regulator transcription factor [Candidatus Acidoferrales bacterium]|nr:response regulator transcription factor [Candidatus Acidoferrales bacterium]
MEARLNVFVLADNRLFREALGRVIKSKNICVAGAAPLSPAALEQVQRSGAAVLVIDPVCGNASDLALVQEIAQAAPHAKIVVIDMLDSESTFLEWVRAGAVGYVLQTASAEDILAAVRGVAADEAVCPPHLCRALFKYVASSRPGAPLLRSKAQTGLTRREQQLVPLIAQGFTNKEIASCLNLSEQTVKNHIHRILQRVGASDRLAVAEMVQGV